MNTPPRPTPAAGPRTPVVATPARVRGSVRRTTTIDALRPDGWAGRLHVVARGRDLCTTGAGDSVVLGREGFTAELSSDRVLREVVHADPRVRALAGAAVGRGFRLRAQELLADEAEHASLLNLLLDDLPGASLVSGYALQRDPAWPSPSVTFEHLGAMHDLCAGWAIDGNILRVVREEGRIPVPPTASVPATTETDPDAWHERPALPPGAMRRARRIDVVADDPGGTTVAFDVHFRDSHQDARDSEGAVHEYTVIGRYAPETRTIVALDAAAPVLPWAECPRALGSVARVVGTVADDLRERVRATFTGTSTCTHLNDVLRALADLPALAAAVISMPTRAPRASLCRDGEGQDPCDPGDPSVARARRRVRDAPVRLRRQGRYQRFVERTGRE